eukprot:1151408-Karenia_brevis.AAC.1
MLAGDCATRLRPLPHGHPDGNGQADRPRKEGRPAVWTALTFATTHQYCKGVDVQHALEVRVRSCHVHKHNKKCVRWTWDYQEGIAISALLMRARTM